MNKSVPLISVALCTYNGAHYLSEQLESILCQSYHNLEVIIVDDCSTDGTWSIISNFADNDPRIRMHQNSFNLGFNKNFEKAISLTTGDFIALSDQDDLWYQNKIQDLYDAIDDNWVIFSNSELISSEGALLDTSLLKHFQFGNQKYDSLLLNNYVTGHTTLINRVGLSELLPIPENGFYDWWLGFVASYNNKLGFLDKVLTKYRIHGNSVIQQINIKQNIVKETNEPELVAQLSSFLNYRRLSVPDKQNIERVFNLVKQVKSGKSWPLYNLIILKYPVYFSHKKSRGLFSRLNFARKFTRTI